MTGEIWSKGGRTSLTFVHNKNLSHFPPCESPGPGLDILDMFCNGARPLANPSKRVQSDTSNVQRSQA